MTERAVTGLTDTTWQRTRFQVIEVLGLWSWAFGLGPLVFDLCTLYFVLGLLKVKLLCHDVKVQSTKTKYKDQRLILAPLPNPALEYKPPDDQVKSRGVPDQSGRTPQSL